LYKVNKINLYNMQKYSERYKGRLTN